MLTRWEYSKGGLNAWYDDAQRAAWAVCLAVCLASLLAVLIRWRSPNAVKETPTESTRQSQRKVVLIGCEEAGKTNLFLRLAMDVAPHTATSQEVNSAMIEQSSEHAAYHLVDVPGHARLRSAVYEHSRDADLLVFCVDASVASRGSNELTSASATTSTGKRSDLHTALINTVDLFHETMGALAQSRASSPKSKREPPYLAIVFTRADKSPVFAERQNLQDAKRRTQLLTRCRRGLDSTLQSRRASRGLNSSDGRIAMEGITEVADIRGSVWQRARTALQPYFSRVPFLPKPNNQQERIAAELHPTRLGHNVRSGEMHQKEIQQDYLRPTQRGMDDVFTQFNPNVIHNGTAHIMISSIDRSSTWQPAGGEDYLNDVNSWLSSHLP
ncbi:hypothetical protein MYAM1_000131 [Malassezia yamatoensis]|uniref:Signal recognition particle receptor subunit beta n=1 Tax=Malassezia yamatoensis TaxID=253288 RepID=A0AAJ5YQP7_9BASI|nr:hypothetical protein MYAM1_000131 [Malassezia yamatoensis]